MTENENPSLSFPRFQLKWDARAGPILLVSFKNKKIGFAFICHRKPERCLNFRGRQSFFCARCTGICIGSFAVFLLSIFRFALPHSVSILLTLPMILDGITQLLGLRESNNFMRFVTGLLFSIGFFSLVVK